MMGLHQGENLSPWCLMVYATMTHEGNIPLRDRLLNRKKNKTIKKRSTFRGDWEVTIKIVFVHYSD